MHELGIVYEIVKQVDGIATEYGLTTVDTIVLEIGEFSAAIPQYLESCFPAAVDGTRFQNTKLRIEVIKGSVACKTCGTVYHLGDKRGACPHCASEDWDVHQGRECMIKEIIAC